jgi:hypothetical protein
MKIGECIMSDITRNEAYFNAAYKKFIADGGARDMAEAAATTALVEHCIREKRYDIWKEELRDFLREYDVICVFNVAGDPQFGLYRYDDDNMILFGTADGMMFKYI